MIQVRHGLALATLALGFGLVTPAAHAQREGEFAEAVSTEAPEENTLNWNLAAGGVFNGGNTNSWSLNAGTNLRFVRGRHGLSVEWLFTYGRAAARRGADDPEVVAGTAEEGTFGDTEDVARNSNARARYDFFLTDNDILFAALVHRWDTFAGLDTRLQGQLGYLRYFLNEEKHQIWGEIGYDITYDTFVADVEDDVVHSARLYVGYNNQLRENVQFRLGLEALFDFEKFFGNADTDEEGFPGNDGDFGENLRLTFDAGLNVTVVDSLQLGIAFKLLYDEQPAGFAISEDRNVLLERVDTITTLSLVYSIL
ncbi:MAG: DUF481 domain-containing protein [Myxococcota bacterium]